CAVLWFMAPALLSVWIGMATPETITIFHFMVLTVLSVALGEGGLNATWATGDASGGVRVVALWGAPVTLLGFPLMLVMGVRGAALALMLSSMAMTFEFTRRACQVNGLSLVAVARESVRGLAFPVIGTMIVTGLAMSYLTPRGWVGLVSLAAAGEAVYVLLGIAGGFRPDEKALLRALIGRRFRRA